MKKILKRSLFALVLLTIGLLMSQSTSVEAHCSNPQPWYYVGQMIPYYEGYQVGQQCVLGGAQCYCVGYIYYY